MKSKPVPQQRKRVKREIFATPKEFRTLQFENNKRSASHDKGGNEELKDENNAGVGAPVF